MTAHHESQARQPQVVSRVGLYLPPALLLAAAAAWSGFWFYSARLTENLLKDMQAAEAAKGRIWDCADQKVGGFPFRIEVHCASLAIRDNEGRGARIRTGALHVATQIYAPTLLLADVDGPMVLENAGTTTTAAWSNMRVSVRFSHRLDRLSVQVADPQLEVQSDGANKITNAAKSAEFHMRLDPARPVEDQAVDLAVELADVTSPAFNELIGSSEKFNFGVSGAATKLANAPPQPLDRMLESWRTAGGVFNVDSGKFAKGALQIEAKGLLGLDTSRRLQGQVNVSAKGLGPIVARFGGNNMNQLIGPLFTRKDGSAVQWPLQLQDGRLQMGPLRTGPILSPLY